MSVVARQTRKGTVYWVALRFAGRVVWERSGTDARAAEKLERRRKRELKLGTFRPRERRYGETVGGFAKNWLAARTVRSAGDERRWLNLHALSRSWFAELRLDEIEPRHVEQLVKEIRTEPRPLTEREREKGKNVTNIKPPKDKSISNIVGILHVMFEDAGRLGLMTGRNPATLPRRMLKRKRAAEPAIYTPTEIRTLTRNCNIDLVDRVLAALLFFTGMRCGEAAGRRWGHIDPAPTPLACLDVCDQYDRKPLKTDPGDEDNNPVQRRVVPIHPELLAILEDWAPKWKLLVGRPPTADDFIVPRIGARAREKHHTRSTAYKAFRKACEAVGIRAHTLHATRHTFITLCQRGGANHKVVEKITHNADGTIVDRYTHRAWDELCDAISALCLEERVSGRQHLHRPPETLGGNEGIVLNSEHTESRVFPRKARSRTEFDSRRLHRFPASKQPLQKAASRKVNCRCEWRERRTARSLRRAARAPNRRA